MGTHLINFLFYHITLYIKLYWCVVVYATIIIYMYSAGREIYTYGAPSLRPFQSFQHFSHSLFLDLTCSIHIEFLHIFLNSLHSFLMCPLFITLGMWAGKKNVTVRVWSRVREDSEKSNIKERGGRKEIWFNGCQKIKENRDVLRRRHRKHKSQAVSESHKKARSEYSKIRRKEQGNFKIILWTR